MVTVGLPFREAVLFNVWVTGSKGFHKNELKAHRLKVVSIF
jgi:hypothetical protein